jgi:hypothetical protein
VSCVSLVFVMYFFNWHFLFCCCIFINFFITVPIYSKKTIFNSLSFIACTLVENFLRSKRRVKKPIKYLYNNNSKGTDISSQVKKKGA